MSNISHCTEYLCMFNTSGSEDIISYSLTIFIATVHYIFADKSQLNYIYSVVRSPLNGATKG